jgi:hypothetical protein
VGSSRQS